MSSFGIDWTLPIGLIAGTLAAVSLLRFCDGVGRRRAHAATLRAVAAAELAEPGLAAAEPGTDERGEPHSTRGSRVEAGRPSEGPRRSVRAACPSPRTAAQRSKGAQQ